MKQALALAKLFNSDEWKEVTGLETDLLDAFKTHALRIRHEQKTTEDIALEYAYQKGKRDAFVILFSEREKLLDLLRSEDEKEDQENK